MSSFQTQSFQEPILKHVTYLLLNEEQKQNMDYDMSDQNVVDDGQDLHNDGQVLPNDEQNLLDILNNLFDAQDGGEDSEEDDVIGSLAKLSKGVIVLSSLRRIFYVDAQTSNSLLEVDLSQRGVIQIKKIVKLSKTRIAVHVKHNDNNEAVYFLQTNNSYTTHRRPSAFRFPSNRTLDDIIYMKTKNWLAIVFDQRSIMFIDTQTLEVKKQSEICKECTIISCTFLSNIFINGRFYDELFAINCYDCGSQISYGLWDLCSQSYIFTKIIDISEVFTESYQYSYRISRIQLSNSRTDEEKTIDKKQNTEENEENNKENEKNIKENEQNTNKKENNRDKEEDSADREENHPDKEKNNTVKEENIDDNEKDNKENTKKKNTKKKNLRKEKMSKQDKPLIVLSGYNYQAYIQDAHDGEILKVGQNYQTTIFCDLKQEDLIIPFYNIVKRGSKESRFTFIDLEVHPQYQEVFNFHLEEDFATSLSCYKDPIGVVRCHDSAKKDEESQRMKFIVVTKSGSLMCYEQA